LADISQASVSILEIAKSCESHKDPYLVNKYAAQMLRSDKHSSVKTPDKLNLLLLECRDLLNRVEYKTARCVICLVKLTEGLNRGIKLNCKHVACFKCIISQSTTNCPIDNQEIACEEYLNSIQDHLMLCHCEHSFKPGESVYKLPCFHSSCEEHYQYGYCFQCGFSFDKWPNNQKHLSNLRSKIQAFYDLKCIVHNKRAYHMRIFPLGFYCEDCVYFNNPDDQKTNKREIISIETIKHLIVKYVRSEYDLKKIELTNSAKNFDLSNNLIKLFTYLNTKSLSCRFLATSIILALNSSPELVNSKSILLFNHSFIPKIWNREKYHLEKKTSVIINFKLTSDTILTGVIMSKLSLPYVDLDSVHYIPISVKINYYLEESNEVLETKEVTNFSPYPNTPESIEIESFKKKDFGIYNFSHPIYLPSSKMNYELIVEINPGYYFFSKPMSKLKHVFLEYLKIKRKTRTPGPVIDGSISSPLFGICAANVDSIISIQ